MKQKQSTLTVATRGRGFTEITTQVQQAVADAAVNIGLCNVFCRHTSASLIITENADVDVRVDLETIFARLAPDGDAAYRHTYEGNDDMAAHVRSVLTETSINIPIQAGRAALGTWQGVYLWEHRYDAHHRQLIVTIQGS